MKNYGVVPEFSFVLGAPPDPIGDMEKTFEFIRQIKRVNPATEVILYTYTPVPMDGGAVRGGVAPRVRVSTDARGVGVRRVAAADAAPRRRHPVAGRVDSPAGAQLRARAERVLSDGDRSAAHRPPSRACCKMASGWRYALKWYTAPFELRALQRLMHYQRPETTGF